MNNTIEGYLKKITYYNPENSYMVGTIEQKEGDCKDVVFTGNIVSVNIGEYLTLKGKWIKHPKFGLQFNVENYNVFMPDDIHSIEKYLSSGLIKGIGKKTAKLLVSRFKGSTLRIIDEKPQKLMEIEGIGKSKYRDITEAWQKQKEIRDIMIFFQKYDISVLYAEKIYRVYKKDTMNIIRKNPYVLTETIKGVGFLKADKIAKKTGIAHNSVKRCKAGILYLLNDHTVSRGHTFYPYKDLIKESSVLLRADKEIIKKAFSEIFEEKKIVIEDMNKKDQDFIKDNKAVYMSPFYYTEKKIAKKLLELNQQKSSIIINIEKEIKNTEKFLNISLSNNQRDAIKKSLENKILIITGGPGTGKTTIIRSIINIFSKQNKKVLLSAPTGRAAKRMSEASEYPAKTIHRMLKWNFKKRCFSKNEDNPLDADLIVLDEASMIDSFLMLHFLKAVQKNCRLIFVGDINQLPPVGSGNVFKDIINSNYFAKTTLDKIFRQTRDSLIIQNAHRINRGERPFWGNNENDDFFFIEKESTKDILDTVLDLAINRIPKKYKFNMMKDIQILTPMHKGDIGSININKEFQNKLNTETSYIFKNNVFLKINDKVMQIRNNYDKDVFNGDIGFVKAISKEDQKICIKFDNKNVLYDFNELDELILAYAITVHKSQGSEYEAVLIPIHTKHYIMLQRNLIYTAVTRAKKLSVIVGSKKAFFIGINNNKPQGRNTGLIYRLNEYIQKK